MKHLLSALAVGILASPASAMTLVSLHGGTTVTLTAAPTDMVLVGAMFAALAAVVGYRFTKS